MIKSFIKWVITLFKKENESYIDYTVSLRYFDTSFSFNNYSEYNKTVYETKYRRENGGIAKGIAFRADFEEPHLVLEPGECRFIRSPYFLLTNKLEFMKFVPNPKIVDKMDVSIELTHEANRMLNYGCKTPNNGKLYSFRVMIKNVGHTTISFSNCTEIGLFTFIKNGKICKPRNLFDKK